jgi:hypothetical protein
MPYLLDGNNLMGLARQRGLGGLAERRGLVSAVAALARAKGGRYTVVFDGGPDAHFVSGAGLGSVRVEFAAPRSADDRILALLRAAANPRNWTVVSADRALVTAARNAGAKALDTADFLIRLAGLPAGAGEKPDARAVDTAEWEEYFRSGRDEEGE